MLGCQAQPKTWRSHTILLYIHIIGTAMGAIPPFIIYKIYDTGKKKRSYHISVIQLVWRDSIENLTEDNQKLLIANTYDCYLHDSQQFLREVEDLNIAVRSDN